MIHVNFAALGLSFSRVTLRVKALTLVECHSETSTQMWRLLLQPALVAGGFFHYYFYHSLGWLLYDLWFLCCFFLLLPSTVTLRYIYKHVICL